MESFRHRQQGDLLIQPLRHHWRERDDVYVGGNMFLYFSALQARRNDFRGPDVFVVLDTPAHERRAWIIWEEDGRAPDLIIELLSDSTREQDQGRKKQIYERVLRVPEYFLFDPWSGELQGYRLTSGSYHEVVPDGSGRLASAALGLQLGVWHGCYDGVAAAWLRWHDADGRLLPTAGELAESAAAQAEQAEARAEQAEARAVREAEARTRAEARVEGLARHLAELTGKPLP